MSISREMENDLTYEEIQTQRHHAAEQLIMQTVKHHSVHGGISRFGIMTETRIAGKIVDDVMKDLLQGKAVMLTPPSIGDRYYIPFKETEGRTMGRPVRILPVAPVRTPIMIRERESRDDYYAICPECNTMLRCSKRGNLVNNVRNHLMRRHGLTAEDVRHRLIEDGVISSQKSAAALYRNVKATGEVA